MIRISLSTVGLFYLRNFPALDHNQRAFSMGRTVRETEKHILCPVHQLSSMAESGRMRQSNAIERVRYYGRIKCLWVHAEGSSYRRRRWKPQGRVSFSPPSYLNSKKVRISFLPRFRPGPFSNSRIIFQLHPLILASRFS